MSATVEQILKNVEDEYYRAVLKFPPFKSAHEGYAVILEELDELWDEIKKKESERDLECMGQEAIQVAAMAIRLVKDVVEKAP